MSTRTLLDIIRCNNGAWEYSKYTSTIVAAETRDKWTYLYVWCWSMLRLLQAKCLPTLSWLCCKFSPKWTKKLKIWIQNMETRCIPIEFTDLKTEITVAGEKITGPTIQNLIIKKCACSEIQACIRWVTELTKRLRILSVIKFKILWFRFTFSSLLVNIRVE